MTQGSVKDLQKDLTVSVSISVSVSVSVSVYVGHFFFMVHVFGAGVAGVV